MALRGNLKDFSLPDVFQLVQLSGKTGVLRIAGEDGAGSIWFREGEVFFAQSNWRKDRLGERLVAAQRITPAALERALELHAAEGSSGRRLGEILVGQGYITQQVLETFVAEQIQDTIFDLMRWDDGNFDFEVLPDLAHEDIGFSVSVENIVMEGSRRLEEWQRIKKKVPSTDMVFKMATAPGEGTFEISLKPAEWTLLLLVDGTRSVRELATETRSTDFDVARVIYGLYSAGLLEVTSDEEVERLRAERARREEQRAALELARVAERIAEDATVPAPPVAVIPQAEVEGMIVPAPESSVLPAPAEIEETAKPETTARPEVPEFLSAAVVEPSQDDMDILERMMESVLGQYAAPLARREAQSVVEAVESPAPMPSEVAPSEIEVPSPVVLEPTPDILGESFDFGSLAGLGLDDIPVPPVVEAEPPVVNFQPTGDFETDLRTLGLGEYPEELLRPEVGPSAEPCTPQPEPYEIGTGFADFLLIEGPDEHLLEPEAQPVGTPEEALPVLPDRDLLAETPAELNLVSESVSVLGWPIESFSTPDEVRAEPVLEPDVAPEAAPEPVLEPELASELEPELFFVPEAIAELQSDGTFEQPATEEDDLAALLASLGGPTLIATDALIAEPELPTASDEHLAEPASTPEEPASDGYISTDAYLADLDTDVSFSAGLGDELAALTGAGASRARPQATVTRLPETGEAHMLHRDQMVDKALLMKIIEGIEQL